jgi:hypothetical protein
MHAFVFDAFIQRTVTETGCQLLVAVRQVDLCCGRFVTFVLMEMLKYSCLYTRILASSCECGSEPKDSIGGRQVVDKQNVCYEVGLPCLASVIQS